MDEPDARDLDGGIVRFGTARKIAVVARDAATTAGRRLKSIMVRDVLQWRNGNVRGVRKH
jgi:hypothetical protein